LLVTKIDSIFIFTFILDFAIVVEKLFIYIYTNNRNFHGPCIFFEINITINIFIKNHTNNIPWIQVSSATVII